MWLLLVGAVLFVVCGGGAVGLVSVFGGSSPDPTALSVPPYGLALLKPLNWSTDASRVDGSESIQGWSAVLDAAAKRRVAYALNIKGHPSQAAAKVDFLRSIRNNYEAVPGKANVYDVDDGISMRADEFDIFCFDTDLRYERTKNNCAWWVYWARYGEYRVFVKVVGSDWGRDELVGLVTEIDTNISEKLKTMK